MDNYEGKFPYLPERLNRLGELACNLWWSWHPEARALFYLLAGSGSEFKAQNPVKLLSEMTARCLMQPPEIPASYGAMMLSWPDSTPR